jgi:hypothetical protein
LAKLIVEIKLIIFWLDLKFNLSNIFSPTFGVTAKKTQLHLSTISWLVFAMLTFLNLFLILSYISISWRNENFFKGNF